MNENELKKLLESLRAQPSEAFVLQTMRRVRQSAETGASAWSWPRWVMPTLAFSALSFFIALGYTLQPEAVLADPLLTTSADAVLNDWLGVTES